MSRLLLALALSAGVLSGFPRSAGGPIVQSAVGAFIDGAPAVVVAAGETVAAWRADGSSPHGFPLRLGSGEAAAGSPAAADMDRDRRYDIAVVTTSGKLHLWAGSVPVPGFPARLGAQARAGPSFADVDGDGKLEVIAGDQSGRLHAFKRSGREARGWPVMLGAAVTSAAASARFAGGVSVAVGCQDGKVHVLDGAGRERPGFPLSTGFEVTGSPAFADLDDDGSMDLVVASQDFKLYAVNARGEPLPGFPVAAGYRIYQGPALADLDDDGHVDVVFASADGWVHAVDGTGKPLRGFPVRAAQRFFGGPAIGDLDRDGRLEVVAAASDGQVVALTAGGKPLPGFPARLDAQELAATPLLLDLARDGNLGIFVGVPAGELHGLRATRTGNATAAAPWPTAGGGAEHAGRFGPNPARYRELVLAPDRPRIGDRLSASWKYQSLDAAPGEKEPAPPIEWLRDGKPVPELRGRREVPPRTARKGERWSFVLSPPGGRPVESPDVRIVDTAPGPPAVALDPPRPSRGGPVRLAVTRPSTDADGDPVDYRVEWLLDGASTGVAGTLFPPEKLKKGALLTARVVGSDGELESEPVVADAFIDDTPPGPAAVALEPEHPRRTDPVAVRVVRPATDLDGDALVYHHRWQVAGEARNLPLSAGTLPPGSARKHQKVRVEARAFDGQAEGPPATAEVTVANSAPGQPRVEIWPGSPRRGDALRAVIATPAPDADGDPLTYRYAWKKNGKPLAVTGDPREVPGAETRRGDRFELEAWASDGEAEGPGAHAEVVIGNTPPGAPLVAIEPERPRGGQALKVEVVRPSEDVDGDPVRYDVAWSHEGKAISGEAAETLPAGRFRKHERVRVTVTPHDGRDAGEAGSAEVVVDDAPPGAPGVTLSPARPTAGTPLRVAVTTAAFDPDGDPLGYRQRWLRNGAPFALPDQGQESRRDPYWTTVAEVPARELKKGQRWTVEVQAFDGEAYGPVARAETVIGNVPPPAPRLTIVPESPRRVDGFRVAVTQAPDADGDLVTHRYEWKRNGVKVPLPPWQPEVPRGMARKGERWQVEVVAGDGEAESAPARAEVVVADTRPGPVTISLCDAPVPAGTPLEVKVVEPATDADGDAIVYRYDWSVNGKPLPAGKGAHGISGAGLRKHDLVRVVAAAWDGEGSGPESSAECRVENTPPGAPGIAIEPRAPTARTGMTVSVKRPSTDRDGDAVSYRIQWFRSGLPAGITTAAVAPGLPHHGETWRVVVTPFDGEAAGEPAVASVVIQNTPPPVPGVTLRPETPAVGQPLTCQVKVPERDADEEPIQVRTRWLVGGTPVAISEGKSEVPAGVVRRGERWRCEAWSWDGFALSGRAGAEVAVRNSPPSAPQVTIEPESPRRGDGLACRVAVDSEDPDGDKVTYQYAWWKNDSPVKPGPDPARVAPGQITKGQRWRCQVTPGDGSLQGPPGRAERIVANTPPGPARIRLTPRLPKPGQPLRCEIHGKASDVDGDPIRYRYAWMRNGRLQPFAETSEEVPARLVEAGDRWRCQVTTNDGEANGATTTSGDVLVSESEEPVLREISPPSTPSRPARKRPSTR